MSNDITVYGAFWCPDCRRSKRFLSEHQIKYNWIDIEQDEKAQAHVEEMNNGKRIIPTVTFADGSFLVEPSNAELAEKLGLSTSDPHNFHDVTIIGSGPAGLTSAIYNARDGFSVMVVDEGALGGQASTTEMIDNYPGFPDGIGGSEWASRVVRQAKRFGVEFLQAQTVTKIERRTGGVWIQTKDGSEYGSCALLVATGADYRRMGINREEDFIGAGVHFCSICDGPFYKGKNVAVVGGGNSAAEEAIGLLQFVNHVTIFVRDKKLTASKVLIDKATREERITIRYNTIVTELGGKGGSGKLTSVSIKDKITAAEETIKIDGLFVFIGQKPNSSFLKDDGIALDKYGYILTGHKLADHSDQVAEALATSMPGVFAAGDVRAGSTKQIASASGEGATASLLIRDYLNSM